MFLQILEPKVKFYHAFKRKNLDRIRWTNFFNAKDAIENRVISKNLMETF